MTVPTKSAPREGILKSLPPIEELVLAVGVGLIVFVRPWRDGMTYPEYNVTFTWACAALAAYWAVMVLTGRMQVRFVLPVSLLALFLLVAIVTAAYTIQYDRTYRALITWSGHLLLFCAAANGLRSRTSIAIVIGFLAITTIAESLWAVLHVMYVMPMQRAAVMKDPTLLQTYFDAHSITAELAARLESNRAYGSMLFANALACWLLTGVPLGIAATNGLYLRLSETLSRARETGKVAPESVTERTRVLFATLLVGAAAFVGITLYYIIYFTVSYGPTADMGAHMARWMFYCAALPSAITIAAWVFASRYGASALMFAVSMIVSTLFGLTAVYGLGATYSRGGMLACGGALIVLVLLMVQRKPAIQIQAAQHTVAILLVLASMLPLAHLAVAQQGTPPNAPQREQSGPNMKNLTVEGVNPSWDAMTDPNTALLRLGYWISGLRMFAAHPVTGVGLDNFPTAYPHYQVLGAGDVKYAHNDYLQCASETGIFGLLAFLGFWGYFAVSNARSILRETDRAMRWFRAGTFAGVIGFLLHSFVDFNFFNASLATLAVALAGVSFAFMPDSSTNASPRGRVLAVAVLALVAWTAYAGSRVSKADAALGREETRRVRLIAAELLLGDDQGRRNLSIPFEMKEQTVALLVDDAAARDTMGIVMMPNGPQSRRRAQPGEESHPEARRYMPPESRPAVHKAVLDAIPKWIARCEEADAAYPHDPDVSAHIVQWYDKLREYAPDQSERIRASDETIRWCEVCIERSPLQTAYYDALAKALWSRAELETSTKQLEYYDRAIENWRIRTEIYPVKPVVWREYAAKCIEYGKSRLDAGDSEPGQKLIDEGDRANKHADDLDAQIQKIALGRG
ncbi:MAG: O-antigen ligase family protein [Candidatus Hydrogenedentes bacterium]|nr:O-antigen ligase family protein [Candidatus Hydrogenedentota bacterium]